MEEKVKGHFVESPLTPCWLWGRLGFPLEHTPHAPHPRTSLQLLWLLRAQSPEMRPWEMRWGEGGGQTPPTGHSDSEGSILLRPLRPVHGWPEKHPGVLRVRGAGLGSLCPAMKQSPRHPMNTACMRQVVTRRKEGESQGQDGGSQRGLPKERQPSALQGVVERREPQERHSRGPRPHGGSRATPHGAGTPKLQVEGVWGGGPGRDLARPCPGGGKAAGGGATHSPGDAELQAPQVEGDPGKGLATAARPVARQATAALLTPVW